MDFFTIVMIIALFAVLFGSAALEGIWKMIFLLFFFGAGFYTITTYLAYVNG